MHRQLKIFLPDIPIYQIEDLGYPISHNEQLAVKPLSEDWQAQFCQFVGSVAKDLPWTRLRLAQFEATHFIKTACCCDPVLMQLTHKGAYMLGNAPLQLTQNDAIRVVAQINEKLMGKGEHLYLIDKHAWLYTSDQPLTLSSLPVKDLIGKDMFNHSYTGKDASFWQKLATEIQMLIKQMIDYQGLEPTLPETMMNIHFYDPIDPENLPEIPFIKNESLVIYSNNELIKSFCMNSFLANQTIESMDSNNTNSGLIIAFNNEREAYVEILTYWLSCLQTTHFSSIELICQDGTITSKKRMSWFKRYFKF